MKDALVADRVVTDEAGEEAAHLLLDATYDCSLVDHLARQLGMAYCPSSSEDTLEFLLPELDHILRNWPMNRDLATCKALAHDATKHIDSVHELLALLQAGPPPWKAAKIEHCRVDSLARSLRSALEKALTGSLAQMLENWDEWDVHRLHERRRAAIKVQRAAEKANAVTSRADTASATNIMPIVIGPDGKPIPPPPRRRERPYVPYTRPGRA